MSKDIAISERALLLQMPSDFKRLLLQDVTLLSSDLLMSVAVKYVTGDEESKALFEEQLRSNIKAQRNLLQTDLSLLEEIVKKIKEKVVWWRDLFGSIHLEEMIQMSQALGIPLYLIVDRIMVTPGVVCEVLRKYVVGQDEYLSKLSLAFYIHYLRTYYSEDFPHLPQQPLLVFGPTGVGKTYALQVLSEIFGMPFGVVNCNSLVSAGIVGQGLSDVFTSVYLQHGKQLSSVEHSIILIDEIDKIKKDVVNELLSVTDDNGQVQFRDTYGNRSYDSLVASTKGIMFVYTGTFDILRSVVEKRMNLRAIGYNNRARNNERVDFYEYVTLEDLKETNLSPEILGRIRDIVYAREHNEDTILSILMSSAESPLLSYKCYFEKHGIPLSVEADGAKAIAELTIKKKLGARGLKSVLWQILSDEMADVTTPRSIVINQGYLSKLRWL